MKPQLDHTIVPARDPDASAAYLSEILGLDPPSVYGHFRVVEVGNGVSLDFAQSQGEIESRHYAFLVTEQQFDEVFARIVDRGIPYWADPGHHQRGEINHHDGGRGVYFPDPDGHNLEIITRRYGTGPASGPG